MIQKNQLSNIHDDYIEVSCDLESMISMVKMYEEEYMNREKNEFQDTIRVIKIVAESIKRNMDKVNLDLEDILIKEKE